MPAQTHTQLSGCRSPDREKARQHPPWDWRKTIKQCNAGQGLNNLKGICKPPQNHKRRAGLILGHDELIFVLWYSLWLSINWIGRAGWNRGAERQGNNQSGSKKKKRNVLKEWDLAFLRKNSIPCKHICYYLCGAAWSCAGCTVAPLWSQTATFTWRPSRRGEITTIVTRLSARFIALS